MNKNLNLRKISYFLCILIVAVALCGCINLSQIQVTPTSVPTLAPTPTATLAPTATPRPAPIEIIIGGTGDIMCHKKQLEDARYTGRFEDGVDYYFDHNFRYISPALMYPDLMIGNLETVFASISAGYTGFPFFNTPDSLAKSLKNAGFDVLTTANNHALDQGGAGLVRTISILDNNNLYHTGTFDSPESASSTLIIDVNGVKIGILASAYAIQNIGTITEEEQSYMLSVSSVDYLKSEVADLKNAGAQIIVASMHWGYENNYEVYDDQAQLAPILVEAGVDIIFGHHPHILQSVEYMQVQLPDGTTNSAVVCWSLGNFLANSPMRLEQEGAICYVYLSFDPVTEDVTITKTQVLPTYIFFNRSSLYDFHVLPAGTSFESMNIDDFVIPNNFQSVLDAKYQDVMDSINSDYVEFIGGVPTR